MSILKLLLSRIDKKVMSGLESLLLSSCNLSTLDNDSGSRMYNEIQRSLNDCTVSYQSTAITLDNFFKLFRKKTSLSKGVPAELQIELALLWRTIGIMRYSVGVPAVLTSFYVDLLRTIVDFEPLSLSNFSDDKSDQDNGNQRNGHDDSISVGLVNANSLGHVSTVAVEPSRGVIFAVPELEYLQENSEFEGDEINDPLGIVQKLFNSSESFASSVPIVEKGAMHSVCLALAVKSGRLSLLLQSALLLVSINIENDTVSESCLSNLQILNDIVEYLAAGYSMRAELANIPNNDGPETSIFFSNRSNMGADEPERLLRFRNNTIRSYGICDQTSKITLSFGKADHGKLGLGISQVKLITTCEVGRVIVTRNIVPLQ